MNQYLFNKTLQLTHFCICYSIAKWVEKRNKKPEKTMKLGEIICCIFASKMSVNKKVSEIP